MVVGDVGHDIVVRVGGALTVGGDLPSQVTYSPGGAGANCARWLAASYRHPVVLLGKVGQDLAAAASRQDLDDLGVAHLLAVDSERPTCTVVSVVSADGERTMLSDRGAASVLAPRDIDVAAALEALGPDPGARPHLHLSGFVLLHESSRAAGLHALAEARRLGWSVSVDPQAANLVAAVGNSQFLGWVEGVDLLLPNAAELEALGGAESTLDVVPEIAVTDGSAGARWLTRITSYAQAAPAVEVVDTTGCGDAFNAGLLAAWLSGGGRETALQHGVLAGSAAAARVGTAPR